MVLSLPQLGVKKQNEYFIRFIELNQLIKFSW